jgi:phage-related minor tail protein
MNEDIAVKMDVDTGGLDRALDDLQKKSDLFGRTLTSSFKSAAISGKGLDDVLRQVGMNIAGMALNAGLKPLQDMASGLFSDLLGALPGKAKPHAKGGVVNSPTYFNAGGSLGLMGEAGSEAIMPLMRGADGRLGVAAQGGGSPIHVTFNVTANDAASFRKSEAQVTGMLARAARRGAGTL